MESQKLIEVEDVDGVTYVTIMEERILDGPVIPRLDDLLNTLVDDGGLRMVLDFSTVTYWSSAGLEMLIALHKKLAKLSGKWCICGVIAVVFEGFENTGLNRKITFVADREKALAFHEVEQLEA